MKKKEKRLWQIYKFNKTITNRNSLIIYYQSLVKKIAYFLNKKQITINNISDLISIGQIGLIQSIERFDLSKKCKFATFATPRIRGHILDELKRDLRHDSNSYMEDCEINLEDIIDRRVSPFHIYNYLNLKYDISNLIRSICNPRESRVMEFIYLKNYSQRKISNTMFLSLSSITHLHTSAKEKLKQIENLKGILL